MLANTLTISVNAVNKTLTRIKEPNGNSSIYRLREAAGLFQLTIKQTAYADSKRGGVGVNRFSVELVQELFPVAPSTYPERRKAYTVVEFDSNTTDVTLTRHISKALADFVGLAANADPLLAGEY